MRRFILYNTICIATLFTCGNAVCQYYFYNDNYFESALTWEAGFSTGGMNCLTDLGGRKGIGGKFIKDINWNTTRPCGSVFLNADYKAALSARLQLLFGQITATDQVLKNDLSPAHYRYLRNLNFRSNIKELTLLLEWFPHSIMNQNEEVASVINLYFIAGFGFFSFSPEAFFNNTWIRVSDLHTEGQGFAEYPDRKVYKLSQVNMPLGLGFKYEASPVLNFHVEVIYRKLWTDYLDDVSKTYIDPALFYHYFPPSKANMAAKLAARNKTTDPLFSASPGDIRGNDKRNDAYFSAEIKIGFVIGRQKR